MDIKRICDRLVDDLGVSLACKEGRDGSGDYADLIPSDLDPSEGFLIRVRIGWRTVESAFVPGTYSAVLIKMIGEAQPDKKELFRALAEEVEARGDKLASSINGVPVDPTDTATWPVTEWRSLSLRLESPPTAIDTTDQLQTEQLVISYGERLLGMVLSLLDVEEVRSYENADGLPEGARMQIQVNRYERSHLNRAACMRLKGTCCLVCGFDFGSCFGEVGSGFIHVHHVVPVSEIGDGYVINVASDLVPVCPNCHAMLHRKNPPYAVDELKQILAEPKAYT